MRSWAVLGIVAVLALGGCDVPARSAADSGMEKAPTIESFEKLQPGMVLPTVQMVLGSHGELSSQLQMGDIRSETYHFGGGFGRGVVIVTFQNDHMVSKSQFGLK